MIERLADPEALLLLLALPVLIGRWWRSAGSQAADFSSLGEVEEVGRGWRGWIGWLPGALRVVGMGLLIVALARPQLPLGQTRMSTEGIAVMMVVDRSASMTAPMDYGGQELTRLEAVKRVFRDFVEGGDGLEGRPGDMIGMVAFAAFADTICPLVRTHAPLVQLAMGTDPAPPRQPEGGTAIGDALALAVARLAKAETELARINERSEEPPEFTIRSKVVVLLTDGENNSGRILPIEAAEQAVERGIKVYTIGIGGEGGFTQIRGPNGSPVWISNRINEPLLERMAEMTGGKYWNARDAQTLRSIYKELGELEKSRIETHELENREERFMGWARAGLTLVLIELALGLTVLRRLP